MKKTLIALAAAATVSLGTIGAASAAPTTAFDVTAQNGAAVQKVGYFVYYGHRFYGRGYGFNYFEYCKRLYYKGFVLGWDWARYEYYRHCDRRY
jgi:hypothetical protein